jgi:hypothetical protein
MEFDNGDSVAHSVAVSAAPNSVAAVAHSVAVSAAPNSVAAVSNSVAVAAVANSVAAVADSNVSLAAYDSDEDVEIERDALNLASLIRGTEPCLNDDDCIAECKQS